MQDDLKEILLSEEEIEQICKELGEQLTTDYDGKPLVCVGILKGSVMFMADLIKRINTHLSIDFMDVSSYHGGTESTGEVQILKDLGSSIENKDVLIIEDILETGTTLKSITELLQSRRVNSIEIVTLLDKPNRRKADIEAKYVGKKIPDEFVVGYGLDYKENYRNLPYIGTLKPEIYSK
ncbi:MULTISPECIES: hypoxanthine phosphoribosyltransferase [Staphylococcus]|uniref:Hypoxanthine phosphoribosyltransferase n=1 Tax=Staphylococcus hsinchuensis TaxID=3051183 RepID=A0ABZ3EEN7_9STAP|nr:MULTISPECIES: hypoxanthine phosphoribosyltransferase [unclassified Staphylococcus]